jgi:methylmalonyl-CoA/ethylmalonyl-CoA epimerase
VAFFSQFVKQSKMDYKVDHIGIAVNDLKTSIPLYERLLDAQCYKTEQVPSEAVDTAFFLQNGAKIELVASLDPNGVIAKFIGKKGEGLHHIAFEVPDILVEMERLKKEGFTLLNDAPKLGADNKWVCFVHPKDAGGILIELCQTKK